MRRGFTLLEMAVCVSLLALLVPLILVMGRSLQAANLEAAAQAEAAAAMRSLSEELRRDLQTMAFPEESGLLLRGAGACAQLQYTLGEDGVVWRDGGEGCGASRAIAARVRTLERTEGALKVEFVKQVSPTRERTDTFWLGVGE